jgi:hypothetical protein
MKVVGKTKYGSKVHKVYDTAKTPYQRLLETGVLSVTLICEATIPVR